MLFLAPLDLYGPVELLEEHDAGEGVWQRDLPERPRLVRPAHQPGPAAQGAADKNRYVAPAGDAEGDEPAREVFGGGALSPLPVQGDEVGAGWDSFRDAFLLGGEDLLGGAAVHVFLADLDDLDREVAAEAFRVVGAAFRGPAFELADGDDGGASDHSMPKSWSAASPRASPRA